MYTDKTLAEKKVWQTHSSESMPCPHFLHVCGTVIVVNKILTTGESFGCPLLAEKGPNTHGTAHLCCYSQSHCGFLTVGLKSKSSVFLKSWIFFLGSRNSKEMQAQILTALPPTFLGKGTASVFMHGGFFGNVTLLLSPRSCNFRSDFGDEVNMKRVSPLWVSPGLFSCRW